MGIGASLVRHPRRLRDQRSAFRPRFVDGLTVVTDQGAGVLGSVVAGVRAPRLAPVEPELVLGGDKGPELSLVARAERLSDHHDDDRVPVSDAEESVGLARRKEAGDRTRPAVVIDQLSIGGISHLGQGQKRAR